VPNDVVRGCVLQPCDNHPVIKFFEGNEPVEDFLEMLNRQRRALDLDGKLV
jgi:hypothetical protein